MNILERAIPDAEPADIIAWAEDVDIQVNGASFQRDKVPQIIEPMRAMVDVDTQTGTLVKPVQSAGSTAAEIVVGYWSRFRNGQIQFNWQDDGVSEWRWKSRILPMLESIADLRWAGGFDRNIC